MLNNDPDYKAKDPISRTGKRIFKFCRKFFKNSWGAMRNPRVIVEWSKDIWGIGVNGFWWFITGCRLFRRNVRTSWALAKRVARGEQLSIRERQLMTKTTSDCLRIVPFSLFIIIPFAELLLPVALRFFPGLMPSTFFKSKYDDASLARRLQAKVQMAEFWQDVVMQRTQSIAKDENHVHADKAAELQAFQEKLLTGQKFPTVQEILRFNELFNAEMQISKMNTAQLQAMTKMLGLTPMTLPLHNQLQLRHHITSIRREDRDLLWEGVDGLTKDDLIEACHKRALRFHLVTESEMRAELTRWLEISRQPKISMQLLLWIQSFYLSGEEKAAGFTAPEPEDFQVKVEEKPEVEIDPKDAFDGMEQRQKVRLEATQSRLEELEQEIQEVLAEEEASKEADKAADTQEEEPSSTSAKEEEKMSIVEEVKKEKEKRAEKKEKQKAEKAKKAPSKDWSSALDEEQEDKQTILQRMESLSEAQELNRVIIERQRLMLKNQLEFMSKMRRSVDNADAEHSQGTFRVLLDQRVRLAEMMTSYSKDLDEIETLLNEADSVTQDPNSWSSPSIREGDEEWTSDLFGQLDINQDGVISRREFYHFCNTSEMGPRLKEILASENNQESNGEANSDVTNGQGGARSDKAAGATQTAGRSEATPTMSKLPPTATIWEPKDEKADQRL